MAAQLPVIHPDDLPEVLSTADVKRVLGVSKQRVHQLAKAGKLNPKVNSRTRERYFSRAEVIQYIERNRLREVAERVGGVKSAAVFRLFASGATRADVVMQLEIAPAIVDDLAEAYERQKVEGRLVDPPKPARPPRYVPGVPREDLEDETPGPADLLGARRERTATLMRKVK